MKLSITFFAFLLSFLSFSQVACDSTASEISICQGDLPYFWNNENYTTSGTYIDTLQNENACDSIIVLILTITLIEILHIMDVLNNNIYMNILYLQLLNYSYI